MQVWANGALVDVPGGGTIADLLAVLGLGARSVLVERNGEPVERGSFGQIGLAEGDRVELVRAVAGG